MGRHLFLAEVTLTRPSYPGPDFGGAVQRLGRSGEAPPARRSGLNQPVMKAIASQREQPWVGVRSTCDRDGSPAHGLSQRRRKGTRKWERRDLGTAFVQPFRSVSPYRG